MNDDDDDKFNFYLADKFLDRILQLKEVDENGNVNASVVIIFLLQKYLKTQIPKIKYESEIKRICHILVNDLSWFLKKNIKITFEKETE